MIDATGSIDVVIPDFPSDCDVKSIYEVIFEFGVYLFCIGSFYLFNCCDLPSALSVSCLSIQTFRITNDSLHIQVRYYNIVLEGLPAEVGDVGSHKSRTFSCRDIFNHDPVEREIKSLAIYVHFYMRDATCLNVSLCLPFNTGSTDNHKRIQDGVFHLVMVKHKFPGVPHVCFKA